jgi:hypothetical protein
MTKERLIKKIIIRVVIMIIICVFTTSLSSAVSAIVGNYVALDQMQNDDFAFIIKEMYNNFLKPFCSFAGAVTVGYVVGISTYDVIKFIKNKKED